MPAMPREESPLGPGSVAGISDAAAGGGPLRGGGGGAEGSSPAADGLEDTEDVEVAFGVANKDEVSALASSPAASASSAAVGIGDAVGVAVKERVRPAPAMVPGFCAKKAEVGKGTVGAGRSVI